jgi:DNA-binding GntR family transcriptional regulator
MGRTAQLPGKRVELDIRRRLAAGEWSHGEQMPTVRELAGQYGVAGETVARVMRKLSHEGLLAIAPKWGTFAA